MSNPKKTHFNIDGVSKEENILGKFQPFNFWRSDVSVRQEQIWGDRKIVFLLLGPIYDAANKNDLPAYLSQTELRDVYAQDYANCVSYNSCSFW